MLNVFELSFFFFFFNDTATTEIYTLSLHDALPICSAFVGCAGVAALPPDRGCCALSRHRIPTAGVRDAGRRRHGEGAPCLRRSEEHTSELQSQSNLVCRLLLEKKKMRKINTKCHSQ